MRGLRGLAKALGLTNIGFHCPDCGVNIAAPRKSYFGSGEYKTVCPNGHTLVFTSRVWYE